MSQVRKTRQQKISKSQRLATSTAPDEQSVDAVAVSNGSLLASEMAKPSLAVDSQILDTYTYAWEELRRIAWISLICIGLLLVASLFLSEIPAIVELRNFLHLPNLSPFN